MKLKKGFYIATFNWVDAETDKGTRSKYLIEAINLHDARLKFLEYVERLGIYGFVIDTGVTSIITPVHDES